MADFQNMPDGRPTLRKYDLLEIPGWLEADRSKIQPGSLPTIRIYIDSETSIAVTNPIVFEEWMSR